MTEYVGKLRVGAGVGVGLAPADPQAATVSANTIRSAIQVRLDIGVSL
jgi:hypothetical protein